MPINFENYQQVQSTDNTPAMKWIPSEMPQFIGTYIGEKVIQWKGDSFTRLMFKDIINNADDSIITQDLSCKDYAQLKMKIKGLEGKRLGISWLGEKPHPKSVAKTMHTFSVHIMPWEVETEDKEPF